MAKEQFAYGDTKELLGVLDDAARLSGVSRGRAFEDFVHMTVCALSGGTMEDQYLSVVRRHSDGSKGQRGCDKLAELFGRLVSVMEDTRKDILGDLFQGAITYGEAGQYYTPESITQLMAALTIGEDADGVKKRTACDPCCGSGRLLLAVAEKCPHWEFVGQDIDLRCVRMTAINLALRNLYGYVIWGNSLTNERQLIYRTGFNLRGFTAEVPVGECPAPVQQIAAGEAPPTIESERVPDSVSASSARVNQLRLF